MSDSFSGGQGPGGEAGGRIAWDEEVLDAEPVLSEEELARAEQPPLTLERRREGVILPAAAAAAVAAGGFVAGAAVLGLVHRRSARRPALAKGSSSVGRSLGRRRREPAPQMLQVLSTRSLLVDIHVLGPPAGPNR